MAVLNEKWKNRKVAVYGDGERERELEQWFQRYGCETVQISPDHTKAWEKALPWEHLDILVLGEAEIETGQLENTEEIRKAFDAYINNAMELVSCYLPYMDAGEEKRICFLTKRAASNNESYETELLPENMLRSARNMMAMILKNRLEKEGYTFRICCVESPQECGHGARYFLEDRSRDSCPAHEDERRLVMRDCYQREIPW